ncbi:hypothetical protein COCVIDRAFT_93170, partial [Bipolaris victoriae FI3]
VHRRRSSVWRPMLDRDCTNSAVLVALQLNAERSSLEASRKARTTKINAETELSPSEEQPNAMAPSQQTRSSRREEMAAFRFPAPEDRHALNIFIPEPQMNSPNERASPTSDTTLFDDDDLDVPPMSQITDGHLMHGCTVVEDNRSTNQSLYRAFHRVQEHAAIPIQRRSRQHQCHGSSSQVYDPVSTRHQLRSARYNATMDILTAEEREMEYQHRHTFIGTASLEEFLDLLEISSSHRVMRSAVVRAFVRLASTEQLYARQCSTKLDRWGLVARTTLDYRDTASVDYVVQSRIKLGSISLRQLLDMVPFEQDNGAAVTKVVDAFSAASHMDAKTNMDMSNKARALRSWIVSQQMDAGWC